MSFNSKLLKITISSSRFKNSGLKNFLISLSTTFLINKDDPLLNYWKKLHDLDALDLRIMDNVGMEFTSQLIWKWANEYLHDKDKGRTCCWKTESKENKSNKASYEEIPDWFKS